ncbi:MAG: ankyrin repeat domain-containing protein [Wolbachia endosymbiont of Tyrophagus putrescentiae]|nr:ankyrin repeat domain-containing protein [Wolbachia endosymbiont of Tyrophagus putrescentiae]
MSRNSIVHKNGLILLIVLAVCTTIIYIFISEKEYKDSITKLEMASETCNLETIKSLMENNISIGEKALSYAAREGCLEIIKFLVEKGVDVNAANKFKWTALHSAADKGYLEIVAFLLENGANPNINDSNGKKPRRIAVMASRHNKDKPYDEIISLLYDAEQSYKHEK